MDKITKDFVDLLTSNRQKEQREEAQRYVDKLYELGTPIRVIKILGNWHSIYKCKILKAPIPWHGVNCDYEHSDEDEIILNWLNEE